MRTRSLSEALDIGFSNHLRNTYGIYHLPLPSMHQAPHRATRVGLETQELEVLPYQHYLRFRLGFPVLLHQVYNQGSCKRHMVPESAGTI